MINTYYKTYIINKEISGIVKKEVIRIENATLAININGSYYIIGITNNNKKIYAPFYDVAEKGDSIYKAAQSETIGSLKKMGINIILDWFVNI